MGISSHFWEPKVSNFQIVLSIENWLSILNKIKERIGLGTKETLVLNPNFVVREGPFSLDLCYKHTFNFHSKIGI
jgi:hypothetical protein